ncbi:hypothetical protein H257_10003 [Aphanomyces astaci]|uniref:Receptor expression-enhancing protein n=2 Tax=Aphanomyces astaci TaxID=112090 RepID=W4G7C1_APHAT|nr:hypothetical protein H257_10003 [Aphanomyces astaci]ETV75587.1 hypothetical protein H257_10003 [Aphanomyces astaci]RHY00129.1 hypothetical protein DYB36_013393 [Aphanomyces astaci]RHY55670.1 hypothetical protein DYB34_002060 [Aphanomyces astaci]RHY91270.1 hypothetical protein DYB35_003426 [Aphanomyces astaci]RHY92852.1 hypothetical protein DYB31_013846 [Aphanomyces astaci]|eukprot:XP_009834718.1 hypothetical protein H257_10003 [Aphanomyces astaci]
MEQVQAYADKIKVELNKLPFLVEAEKQTGVDKLYLAAGGSLVLLVVVLFGFGAGLLCNLVGFVYPAYESFKAIESDNSNDDTQWLTYWVVYSMFQIVEVFVDFLLYFIPFYYAIKLGFLVWLFMPSTQGATFVFNHLLQPFLKRHESTIDGAINNIKNNSGKVVGDLSGLAADVGKDVTAAVLQKVADNQLKTPTSPKKSA